MPEYFSDSGLYWRPLGGNNIDQISGHCYQYTDIIVNNSYFQASTIIVDIGKFDNHQALGIKNSLVQSFQKGKSSGGWIMYEPFPLFIEDSSR